jgi:hypothetical protein
MNKIFLIIAISLFLYIASMVYVYEYPESIGLQKPYAGIREGDYSLERMEELEELKFLTEMSCKTIVNDTYNRIDGYESSDNRGFVRDKVQDCIREQDVMVREIDCFGVFTMMKDPMDFYVEDTQLHLEYRAEKCQADPHEVEMYKKFEECRAKGDHVSFHNGTCTLYE